MVDIRLDQGLTNPSDIRLSDPTVVLFTEGSWHQPLSQPRTQDFTAKAFAVALIASGVTQVMGPVFGSGDVAFASTNTIVPHSRTVLYQSLFSPVPIVALDAAPSKWHKPLSEPTRKPSIIHEQGGVFYVGAPPFSVAENRWFAPLSEPTRRKPTVQPDALIWSSFTPSAAVETVTLDKWLQPLVEPVRRKPTVQPDAISWAAQVFPGSGDVIFASSNTVVPYSRTLLYQAQAYAPFTPASAEAVTVDKWFAPFADQERVRPGLPAHQQQSLAFVKAAPFPEAVSIDKWLLPLSEPVRWRGLGVASQPYLAFVKAAPFPETVSVDRWIQPLSMPTRIGGLPTASQPYLAFVKADPFPESVSIDRWLQALSEPTRRKATVQPDGLSWSYFTPASTEVVTVDKYYNWLSEPVRARLLPPHEQQALAWSGFTPAPEDVTLDKWLAPLSEPIRLKLGLAASEQAYLFFVNVEPFVVPVVKKAVGRVTKGGGQRTRIKPRKAWDRTFSRETWTEVQALLKAEQEALDKAVRLDDAKAKAALERATDAASEAIDEINRQAFIEAGQVARLTRALEGAAGAATVKATLRQAQLVNEYAAALMAHLAEMEDEDEAIVLLMM